MFAKTSKFAALGILLVLFVVGCGSKEPVVARVGREKITLKEFKDSFLQRYRSEDNAQRQSYEDREKAVRDMAVQLAKYQEAVALGLDKNPDYTKNVEEAAHRKALDLLYLDQVVNKVITDAAAKEFYDKSSEEVRAKHILLRTNPNDSTKGADSVFVKARIDSIKKAISGGLSFGAAAKMFSEDATSAADSGELNWFQWGRMVDAFQEAAWSGKPGQVVGPVRTDYGYHLILIEERRPVQGRQPYEETKESIKVQLRDVLGQKMNDTARAYVEALRKKGNVKYNDANIETFRKKVLDPMTPKGQTLDPIFTDAQKDLETASYRGGKVTIKDMLEKVGANAGRVDWNDMQSAKDLINAIVEPKLLEKDAEDQGYYKKAQKEPEVLAEKRRGLSGQLEKTEVTDKIKPTDTDDRRFYDSHLSNYIQAEMRTVREIFIKDDSTKCARIRDRALKGENFAKLALRFNEKESTKADTGRLGPFAEKGFGLLGKPAFALTKVGDISPVTAVGKNYSVIQLVSITPSRTKSFEEAQAQVRQQNRQAMTDQAMKDLEDRLAKKYPVEIDVKVLSSAWPLAQSSNPAVPGKIAKQP
jgi:parvulin-like peptidyl-prolyl isomerase